MKTKAVYQTNENGLFLYEGTANELALSPGDYNIPFGALVVKPPRSSSG